MRITRGSPPSGEAFPSRHSTMRRSRLCPLHPVTCREIPRRAYPLLGMTRRTEQHFSHVGTSPRRSLFAASSKPFRKRAILLASEIAQRTGTCPRYIQQKNPSAGLGFLLLFQPYLTILETTPEPTVLPPSRIAKRRPSSIATGLMSSTVIVTWSPGMTISTPSGSSMEPVTSVVRMKN